MKSKELLGRFGKRYFLFDVATILCTERVEEPEKSYLLNDSSNFGELILEVETIQPIGFLRKKNFFFELNEENLKEAQIAFRGGEIANWHIRRSKSSDTSFSSFIEQLNSQTY